jgi:hypothetical protein
MDEDNPDYLVHEIFTRISERSSLGKPILGRKRRLSALTALGR